MHTRAASALVTFGLMLAGAALAAPSAHNSDAVPPNAPLKERGFPDPGNFNPNGDGLAPAAPPVVVLAPAAAPSYAVAPAAATYPPPIVISERAPRPYALVAAPTLPCAPGYCAPLRPRRDRH